MNFERLVDHAEVAATDADGVAAGIQHGLWSGLLGQSESLDEGRVLIEHCCVAQFAELDRRTIGSRQVEGDRLGRCQIELGQIALFIRFQVRDESAVARRVARDQVA